MAAIDVVLDALKEDIIKTISRIKPKKNGDRKFRVLRNWEGERPSGKIRGFYVSLGEAERRTIGSSSRTYTLDCNLVIGYPIEGWDVARIVDTDEVSRALGESAGQTDITGISFRVTDPDAPAETNISDDWIWVTHPIKAVIETTE